MYMYIYIYIYIRIYRASFQLVHKWPKHNVRKINLRGSPGGVGGTNLLYIYIYIYISHTHTHVSIGQALSLCTSGQIITSVKSI